MDNDFPVLTMILVILKLKVLVVLLETTMILTLTALTWSLR